MTEWILCPVCANKTRDRLREDTVLKILSPLLSKMQAGNADRRKEFTNNRYSKIKQESMGVTIWKSSSIKIHTNSRL